MSIRLIIGLGNPGLMYKQTRHNIGFRFVTDLADDICFKYRAHFNGLLASITIEGNNIFLLKPQTYMNASGHSVISVMSFYKIQAEQVLVVHDDLDLLPGVVKIKKGGSSGGHNGLKNIIVALGTRFYWRLRIGIGHPRSLNLHQSVLNFVLDKPCVKEKVLIDVAINKSLAIIPFLCRGKFEIGIQQLHSSF